MLDVVDNLDMIIRTCGVLKEIHENLWKFGKRRVSCGHVVMWSCGHVLIPRVSALFLLLAGVCIGRAQVYGQVQETVDNAILTAKVSIPGVTGYGHRISGTNVPLSCESKAQNSGASVSDPVVQVRLKRAVLTIGGQSVYNDAYNVAFNEPEPSLSATSLVAPAPQGQEPVLYPDVRDPRDVIFASTKFEHESAVAVTLTLTYVLKRSSGASDEHELDPAVITPQAYNNLLIWRTHVTEANTNPPFIPLIPFMPTWDAWVEDSKEEAIAWYENANYGVTYNSQATKSQIEAALASVTSVFGITHGDETSVTDGVGIGTAYSLTWSDIESSLEDRYTSTTLPQVSHLFFYACATVPGQSPDLFWLSRVPRAATGDIVNAGSLGFDRSYIFTYHEMQHIHALFHYLSDGYTISAALLEVNEHNAIPVDANSSEEEDFEAALAVWLGDPFATFSNVYLPPDVRSALSAPYVYVNWWWAPPLVP